MITTTTEKENTMSATTLPVPAEVLEAVPDVDLDKPLTLADAMRAGASCTTQAFNWGNADNVCALTAAAIAAQAWGFAK